MKNKVYASFMLVLVASLLTAPFASAITASGVLEEGKDYIHFDLTLTVDFTSATVKMMEMERPEVKEVLSRARTELRDKLGELERKLSEIEDAIAAVADRRPDISESLDELLEAIREFKEEVSEEKAEERPELEEVLEEVGDFLKEVVKFARRHPMVMPVLRAEGVDVEHELHVFVTRAIKLSELIERVPDFKEEMRERCEKLWEDHVRGDVLAACWETPALQRGLKEALGNALNRTLQRIYGTTDVYVKNFILSIEIVKRIDYVDGDPIVTGTFTLSQSFDLHGIVTVNASGVFIRSQFRCFNVTEDVEVEVPEEVAGFRRWKFTPAKVMFLDLSVFSVPLEEWDRFYDPAANSTTFRLVKNLNITTPFGNVIIDPEYTLTVPGDATGSGEVIMVKAPTVAVAFPVDLLPILATIIIAAAITIVIAAYWVRRRSLVASVGTLKPS
jgi:Skp family chaperone for outer membrane proteins